MFNYRVSELGFEAALESLIKKHIVDIDRFIETNNYFNQPKDQVTKIFYAIQDPESNRVLLESLGMAETVSHFVPFEVYPNWEVYYYESVQTLSMCCLESRRRIRSKDEVQ